KWNLAAGGELSHRWVSDAWNRNPGCEWGWKSRPGSGERVLESANVFWRSGRDSGRTGRRHVPGSHPVQDHHTSSILGGGAGPEWGLTPGHCCRGKHRECAAQRTARPDRHATCIFGESIAHRPAGEIYGDDYISEPSAGRRDSHVLSWHHAD